MKRLFDVKVGSKERKENSMLLERSVLINSRIFLRKYYQSIKDNSFEKLAEPTKWSKIMKINIFCSLF